MPGCALSPEPARIVKEGTATQEVVSTPRPSPTLDPDLRGEGRGLEGGWAGEGGVDGASLSLRPRLVVGVGVVMLRSLEGGAARGDRARTLGDTTGEAAGEEWLEDTGERAGLSPTLAFGP